MVHFYRQPHILWRRTPAVLSIFISLRLRRIHDLSVDLEDRDKNARVNAGGKSPDAAVLAARRAGTLAKADRGHGTTAHYELLCAVSAPLQSTCRRERHKLRHLPRFARRRLGVMPKRSRFLIERFALLEASVTIPAYFSPVVTAASCAPSSCPGTRVTRTRTNRLASKETASRR